MLQHLIVAGVEFRLAYVPDYCDFSAMADRRARELLADVTVPAEVRVFDAGEGTITRYSTASGKLVVGRPKAEYGKVWEGTRYADEPVDHEPDEWWRGPIYPSERVLLEDQLDLMSILYVYDAIYEIGTFQPGTLGEVAFFSHGSREGPRLVGSRHRDGHALDLNAPMWFPAAGMASLTLSFAPPHGPPTPMSEADPFDRWRDPCDMDARIERDVDMYSLPWERAPLRAAFGKGGRVRVFGGTLSCIDFEYLSASIWSRGVTEPGKATELVRIETLSPAASTLVGLAFHRDPSVTVQGEIVTMPRGLWRRFVKQQMRRSWAGQMADLLGVPVFAPPPGLVVAPSADGYLAMKSDLLTDRMAAFAADVLGSGPDPEKRGHLRFDPA